MRPSPQFDSPRLQGLRSTLSDTPFTPRLGGRQGTIDLTPHHAPKPRIHPPITGGIGMGRAHGTRITWTLIVAVILMSSGPTNALPFTFEFSGTHEGWRLGPKPPGAEPFDFTLRLTVDNGGSTPVGFFWIEHWTRYEWISGSYSQVWDITSGGFYEGSDCSLRLMSDGVSAELRACVHPPDDTLFYGGTDNCGSSQPFLNAGCFVPRPTRRQGYVLSLLELAADCGGPRTVAGIVTSDPIVLKGIFVPPVSVDASSFGQIKGRYRP